MKFSDKAKRIIGAIAPGLGAALGGPLGGLAGNMIADALGGAGNVEAALLAQKPEVLLQLKAADQAFALKMEELGVRADELHLLDRADARALAKIDMRPQVALSALFIVGYFLLLGALLFGGVSIPENATEFFYVLFGVITANVPTIMQFWFGSSHGSAKKNELIGRRGASA